jgi:hypothetical protein
MNPNMNNITKTKIKDKLNADIARVDVKFTCFCRYIDRHRHEHPNRAEKLINEATMQYNTIQHIYNQIIELINQITLKEYE